jgi:nitroreductase
MPFEERIGVLEELLGERFSCRAFKPDSVPRPIIERILKAAQRTASWCNSQPWQVVIASGEAREIFVKPSMRRRVPASMTVIFRFQGNIAASIWSVGGKAVSSSTIRSVSSGRQGGLRETGAGKFQFLRRAACCDHPHRRGARRLRRDRLRRLCQQFPAGDAGARPWCNSASRACASVRTNPAAFQHRRRPPRGVRNIVWLCGARSPHQQLPHLARRCGRRGSIRRPVATERSPPSGFEKGDRSAASLGRLTQTSFYWRYQPIFA